nr:glycosyltransferase family 4 protein [Candidatus Hydrogenedentota bacterium]
MKEIDWRGAHDDNLKGMRLAFVDLLFSWPPNGGADVDVYHVVQELCLAGHEVQLIGVNDGATWDRGQFVPDSLPFPAVRLDFEGRGFTAQRVSERIRDAVDVFHPEVVVVCDGFFLKPYVIEALGAYPVVSRYYAYEAICHRDITHFKDGATCPNSYLETPDVCRACALERIRPELCRAHPLAWTQEYLTARAYQPEYFKIVQRAWEKTQLAVVYNPQMQSQISSYCKTAVVPGGVDTERFPFSLLPERGPQERKRIVMTGRAEDPLKGVEVLRKAGEDLYKERQDFEILVTLPEDSPRTEWFTPVGWQDYEEIRALYREADICVVPSVWDEPFGMVALEAMSAGRPV